MLFVFILLLLQIFVIGGTIRMRQEIQFLLYARSFNKLLYFNYVSLVYRYLFGIRKANTVLERQIFSLGNIEETVQLGNFHNI